MTNAIAIAVIVLIIGAALAYIIKEKKRGKRCIGCPQGSCENCACHASKQDKD